MAGSGFGLGGFAEGLTSGLDAGNRALAPGRMAAEKQAERQARAAEQARTELLGDIKTLQDGFEKVVGERGAEAGQRLFESLRTKSVTIGDQKLSQLDLIAMRAQQAGIGMITPEILESRLAAQLAGGQSVEERAGQAATVAQATATGTAMGTASVNLSPEVTAARVAQEAAIAKATRGPQNIQTITMFDPRTGQDSLVEVDRADEARMRDLIGKGYIEAPSRVIQSDNPDSLMGVRGEAQAKAKGRIGADAEERATGAASELATLQSAIQQLNRVGPGGVGFRALAAEAGGGLLGQLNAEWGQSFTKLVAGTTQEELTALRTNLIGTIARFIPETTGEESGRFTEAERALANEAAKARDPNASFPQVRSALGALTALKFVSRSKDLLLAGQPLDFDVNTPEGRAQGFKSFAQAGLSPQQGVDLMATIANMSNMIGQPDGLQKLGLDPAKVARK